MISLRNKESKISKVISLRNTNSHKADIPDSRIISIDFDICFRFIYTFSDDSAKRFRGDLISNNKLKSVNIDVHFISSVTGYGIETLKDIMWKKLNIQ